MSILRSKEQVFPEFRPKDGSKNLDISLAEDFHSSVLNSLEFGLFDLELVLSDIKAKILSNPIIDNNFDFLSLEKSLLNSPEIIAKLDFLNKRGHEMNILYENEFFYVFVSSWVDVQKVSKKHRYLVFDEEAFGSFQTNLSALCNGSVEAHISELGVELAGPEDQILIKDLYQIRGRSWLKTDPVLQKNGLALMGRFDDIIEVSKDSCLDFASFRAKIMVPKCF